MSRQRYPYPTSKGENWRVNYGYYILKPIA